MGLVISFLVVPSRCFRLARSCLVTSVLVRGLALGISTLLGILLLQGVLLVLLLRVIELPSSLLPDPVLRVSLGMSAAVGIDAGKDEEDEV